MINLDSLTVEELQDFTTKCGDIKFALELWPEKPIKSVTMLNLLRKYSQEKIEAMTYRFDGKIDKALKHEVKCDNIYSQLMEYARW